MKAFRNLFLLSLLSMFFTLGIIACSDDGEDLGDSTYTLTFRHQMAAEPLRLNQVFTLPGMPAFQIQEFKYYISNISLENSKTGQRYFVPNSYHLLSESGNAEAIIHLPDVPRQDYDRIHFAWGIDATKNTSLDNTGDLDPSNEMAWNWNTGYKFILLEGRMVESNRPLVYHIGFDHNYKELQFAIPGDAALGQKRKVNLDFNVAVEQMFKAVAPIDIEVNNNVMGGPVADKIAQNIHQGLFSLSSIR
jgi:hypothetical protein